MTVRASSAMLAATQRPRTGRNVSTKGWRMRLSRAITLWIEELRVQGAAKGTITGYEGDLRKLAMLAIAEGDDHIAVFDAALCLRFMAEARHAGLKPGTLCRKQAALSSFAKWGIRKRLWLANPMDELPRVEKPKTLPRPFSAEERDRLLALPLSPYERLVRGLLLFTGLRVTPITQLKVGDLTLGGDQPHLRATCKGAKVQVVMLHAEVRELIERYLADRGDLRLHSYLLATKSGRAPQREHIEAMTAVWGLNADVPNCTPHRFRHTYATGLLEEGVDLRVIRDALGHADVSSTMIYTKVSDAVLAREIGKLRWKA